MTLSEIVGKVCKYGTPLGCTNDDEEEEKEKKNSKSK